MSVSAVLLFGSLARQDNARGSDTDLLLVAPGSRPRHIFLGHLSMFFYSWTKLKRDAAAGDLFVCHLVREARPLFDPENRLAALQTLFRFKASYQGEIEKAADLGWYLDRFGSVLAPHVTARRMIWCVRTILIARSVEAGTPVFSPQALASVARSEAARELLHARHQRRPDALLRGLFRRFLREETTSSDLRSEAPAELLEGHFIATANNVALQTLKRGRKADASNPSTGDSYTEEVGASRTQASTGESAR
jgi:hypothetical protein